MTAIGNIRIANFRPGDVATPVRSDRITGYCLCSECPGCSRLSRAWGSVLLSKGTALSKTSRRSFFAAVVSCGMVAASLGSAVAGPSSHGKAATIYSRPASAVIVLLRNQHTDLPIARGRTSARASANRNDQSTLIARAKSAGVSNLHSFASINAFSATVTPAQAAALVSDPSVAAVVPDETLTLGPSQKQAIQTAMKAETVVPDSSVCPSDPSQPLLEPEALQVTNTAFSDPSIPQAQTIVDGTGVKVAYIADGIDINNPDFIRADGTHVFVDYQDFSGEGPNAPSGAAEAFGDASAIAAQGRQVYDLSNFVNPAHPLPAGCNITVRGMAPGASLVGLKVFGNANSAPTSRFIEAIDYAISTGVDVLNESFGANPYPDNNNDPISLADHAAVAAGITVTASSGDAGTNGTNGSPSTSAGVIAVGATTTFRSYAQTTSSGVQLGNGTWIDNNISGLSSGGVTQQGRVPDLVAPGDLGWALCSTDTTTYKECTNDAGQPSPIQDFGGTSQSSAAHRRRGRAGHRGVQEHPRRRPADPGVGAATADQHGHGRGTSGLRAGRRAPRQPGRGGRR